MNGQDRRALHNYGRAWRGRKDPMGIEAMASERKRGASWAEGLYMSDVHALIDAMVLDEFDWRDWFDAKPSAPFLSGAFDAAQSREEMAGYGD